MTSRFKRIWVASPYGKDGMGGIDRLNDAIFAALSSCSDLEMSCTRLVTRGKRGLVWAQVVFAIALLRFCLNASMGKIDLLHIHLSNGGSSYRKTILGEAARLFGVPYVVHLHGIEFREFWAGAHPLLQKALKRLHAGSTYVITLGQFWADVILERVPDIASRIVVLPNATPAVPNQSAAREADTVHVAFLGRVGARKGVPDLLKGLARLSHLPNWVATIAGDGDLVGARLHAQELGIGCRLEIPGWLDLPARTKLLRQADIVVLPSRAENLPMVIIEAFAYGLPVVSTPVGAIPEVLKDGVNGLLVPPGDHIALARALERLIQDPGLRSELGRNARLAHQQCYELGIYVRRLAAIWQQACRRGN